MGIIDRIILLFTKNKQTNQSRTPKEPQRKQSKDHDTGQRGQVIRKEELGSIKTQGLELKASIEVRRFTEEETRQNAEENRCYFEPAFWRVANGIQANKASLNALLPELLVAFTSGDPRRETQAVMQHLPEGTWRWPGYEDYVLKRDGDMVKRETDRIKSSDLSDLLTCLTIAELRDLYKQHGGEKRKSPGRKKSDIVSSLMGTIGQTSAVTLAQTLRSHFIRKVDEPCEADYREMCLVFARKVTMVAYGIRHRNQMLELADMYPVWRFIADNREAMPEECRRLNGRTFRHDDPFWETHYPPCEWPECSCRVELVMR
jgi:hypothetical protein